MITDLTEVVALNTIYNFVVGNFFLLEIAFSEFEI